MWLLAHDRLEGIAAAARMCATCGRLRAIESPAGRERELVCVECGATSEDGADWRAEIALLGTDEPEVPVYCPECWQEFG